MKLAKIKDAAQVFSNWLQRNVQLKRPSVPNPFMEVIAVARTQPPAPPAIHPTAFDHISPTEDQIGKMADITEAFKICANTILQSVPAGSDQTYILHQLRDCAMWANAAILRNPDGSPKSI